MRSLLILFLIILTTACQKSNHSDHMLRLTYLNEVNSLDPRFGYEIPANCTVKMLFEGLMRIDLKGNVVPAIAEAYSLSSDQKVYTFTLRPSYFSNGEPLTAYDFEYSWKQVIDPKKPTQGKADFYPIKNVENVMTGSCSIDEVGIKALDDKTLLVELENPTPYFLELVTTSAYLPVCKKVDKANPNWAENGGAAFVCNGPFHLKEWKKNEALILEKNPFYWDVDNIYLNDIHIAIVEDAHTQMLLFEKGESDFFGKPFTKLPLDSVKAFEVAKGLYTFPEKAVYWYFLNTTKFPFTNSKIRQAFALATNRQEIVEHVLKEGETVALGICRRETPFFNDHDIEKAKKLFEEGLDELGLTKEQFPILPLSYCGIETNHRIALVVQQQWQHTLGIKVHLDPQEWTTYYDRLSNGELLIGGLSWHSRVKDPLYNLQIFKYKRDRLNMSFWENANFQSLLTQISQEKDSAKRETLLVQAEALLMEHMPVIPIYYLAMTYTKKEGLKDFYVSETNEVDFSRAKWYR